jgi:excinuclease ABC subunit C
MSFLFQANEYPESPGCYLMKDTVGEILYIGKSKNLRSRLRSYFQQEHSRKKIRLLVSQIATIEVILVNNEAESLLLENNLIKIHKPAYNRALKKENSGYAYLQLTEERFPRLDVYYRNRTETSYMYQQQEEISNGHRLGPFKSRYFRDALLEFVTDHFGLRTCSNMPKRVCLLYHIKKCCGICEGMISEEEYIERVKQAAALLTNRGEKLIEAMYTKMQVYAEQLEFERASNMLQHIRNLEKVPDKQIVDREGNLNQDVLYFGEDGRVMLAKVQEGMLRDFQMFELERAYAEMACDHFIVKRYVGERPDELIVNKIANLKKVTALLRVKGAKPLLITQPKRGLKYDLLQLCKSNYEYRTIRNVIHSDLEG